jgi:hypothetical protein
MSNVKNIYNALTWYFTTCMSSVVLFKETSTEIFLYKKAHTLLTQAFFISSDEAAFVLQMRILKTIYLILENLRSSYREQCPYIS